MINQYHRLDVIPGGPIVVVHVKQYQTDENLYFNLYSRLGDLDISAAYTDCTIRGTKSDGNGYSASATCDTVNKRVTVKLTQQMTAVAGRQPYEITITDSTGKMITATFILDVQRAALDDDTVVSDSVIKEIDEEVQSQVAEYIADHPGLFVVDNTLTQPNEAADAKVTGDEIRDLKSDISDMLDDEQYISSVNKLDANSAIGKTASQINGSFFYLGLDKTLNDYADNLSVIVFCRTTTDSINGLTAQWLYDDETVSTGYITLNSSYNVSQVSNKDHVVGIKFVAYSVGASLVISKLGIKFTGNTSATDEDSYALGVKSVRLDNIENRLDFMNLYEFDNADAISLTIGNGVMSIGGAYNTSDAHFKHATGTITAGSHYKVSGRTFGASYPVYLWLNSNDNVVGYGTATDSSDITEVGVAPSGATKICINIYDGHNTPSAILGTLVSTQDYVDEKVADAEKSYWNGKKIVWFGTSIPAGVINDGQQEGEGSYPSRIGAMLGATVYNESIGGSAVRAGDEHAITADDPMGYGGMSAPGLMLSLSLSSTEKQDIFDNWNAKWKDIITYNQNLIVVDNPTYTNMYKNASWDILLAKYLTGGSIGQCDLYVFDHGYNDSVYSYGFADLADVPSTPKDRTYFLGAMAFLIDKILSDNPQAQICFIGHWSNDKGTGNNSTSLVADAQEKLADIWKYPLCKTWEKIGWSANTITSGGTTKPVYQFWCLDGVHPASDTSGKALQHYADTLYPFMRDVR